MPILSLQKFSSNLFFIYTLFIADNQEYITIGFFSVKLIKVNLIQQKKEHNN